MPPIASPSRPSRLSRAAAAALVAAHTLAAGPALAAEPGAEGQMLELNDRGFEHFQAGRFVEAAETFRHAYELSPDPNLRKNEAIAWFKAGRCGAAVPAANSFLLAEETLERDRAEARAVLANCKVDMAKQAIAREHVSLARDLLDEAESLQPDDYTRERIASARAELPPGGSGVSAGDRPLDEPTLHESAEGEGASDLAGWSLLGAGAAIVAGAVVYHVATARAQDEFLRLADDGDARDARRFSELGERLDTARWLLPTLYVAGAASGGVGVYLLVTPGEPTAPGAAAPRAGTTATVGIRVPLP